MLDRTRLICEGTGISTGKQRCLSSIIASGGLRLPLLFCTASILIRLALSAFILEPPPPSAMKLLSVLSLLLVAVASVSATHIVKEQLKGTTRLRQRSVAERILRHSAALAVRIISS